MRFRKATLADAYALWVWANDPDTRAASFARGIIAWQEHVAWLRARLDDTNALVLIAENGEGQPIGSIRFDTSDTWRTARLSYVVAPECRGRGFSRPLIVKGVDHLREAYPSVNVQAEVVHGNVKSLNVFRESGWEEAVTREGVSQFRSCPEGKS